MARQHVDYTTSALSPPNAPADDGLDTGSADATAIRPVVDGQPAQAAVFKRPSENLRTRTEKIRTELENLKYLSDADRALLLTGPGSITWNGQGPGAFPLGTFQMTAATSLTIRPFLAPATSIPSRLIICGNTVAQVTFRTVQQAGTAPRAYSGANDISIDFQPVTTGNGLVVVTATGTPANNVHVQYDDHATNATTVDQFPYNSLIQQFNASAVALSLGLEAVIEGGGVPAEVGFPTPPGVITASKIKDFITGPEQATRHMSGAADAEKHVIPETQLVTFFSDPLNAMLDGDTLCIRYEDLVMSPTDGGRRQSIADLPENNLTIPAGSLFLLRRFPERLPLAVPVCAVASGQLVFINGRVYGAGETGPLVASGASYQGSPAAPNSWADGTVVSGPVSFESALDTIIQTLGKKTAADPGAIKVGFTPSGQISANTVKGALEELDTEKAALGLPTNNTFTNQNTFTPSTAATTAVTATGNTTGRGVTATGGASAATGVYGKGGTGNGIGVEGFGGTGGNGVGVWGTGTGGAVGVQGDGGPSSGTGVYATGGASSGHGVQALGGGPNGSGVIGTGAGAGVGGAFIGDGGAMPAYNGQGLVAAGAGAGDKTGIFAEGGATNGYGVHGRGKGSGAGVLGEGAVGSGGSGVLGRGYGAGSGGTFYADATSGPGNAALNGISQSTAGSKGVWGIGTGIYQGGYFTGGATSPSSFATRMDGAGVEAIAGGTGNGVVARGGSGSNIGSSTLAFSNCGIVGVGSGGGAGIEGIGSATNGAYGVSGTGSTGVNGNGVHGTATGTGTGVRGDGATGGSGHGVYGSGGSTGGYGVYGQALVNGWDGVFGVGKGNGSGILGRGDQAGVGNTSYDVRGVSGFGGPGANSVGTSRGGGGVVGTGGDSFLIPSTGGDYWRGYGGPGLQGQGGSGLFGGNGVEGTGGYAAGNLLDGAGTSGNGGKFTGASADGSSPQLASVGHGAYGFGGNGTNQNGGHGFVGNGGTSDTGLPGYAFYAATGHIKLAGGNPAYNADVGPNVITASSTIKAWAFCSNNLGTGGISSGFNVSALTWDAPNSEYYLTLINNVTVGFACVVATIEGGAYFMSQATGWHTAAVAFHSAIGGARVNMAAVGVTRWSMIVLGVS